MHRVTWILVTLQLMVTVFPQIFLVAFFTVAAEDTRLLLKQAPYYYRKTFFYISVILVYEVIF